MEKITQKPAREEKKFVADARGIVRILSTDIPANAKLYAGLTRIKGVSWSISNALCHLLKLEKNKKISSLTEPEIEKITEFLKAPNIPIFLMNRRRDLATGLDKHLVKTDLEMQREFDIRDMKKIRSYKGWRHAMGQPVRGQRTKSHFRKGSSLGVQRTKAKPATSPATKAKEAKK
jgi:small subunit ribosomal protein S13